MKKKALLFTISFTIFTSASFAQETIMEDSTKSVLSIQSTLALTQLTKESALGQRKYIINEMKNNRPDLFTQYRKGKILCTGGWILIGAGSVCYTFGHY